MNSLFLNLLMYTVIVMATLEELRILMIVVSAQEVTLITMKIVTKTVMVIVLERHLQMIVVSVQVAILVMKRIAMI